MDPVVIPGPLQKLGPLAHQLPGGPGVIGPEDTRLIILSFDDRPYTVRVGRRHRHANSASILPVGNPGLLVSSSQVSPPSIDL